MSQSVVTIRLNGHPYKIGCGAGEEDHVAKLGSEVEVVAREGIQTFITGEGPHWSHPLAEELGLHVLYAGHYATETFGVRALAELIGGRFALKSVFIDYPTGL